MRYNLSNIARELATDVLQGLEKCLRGRTKDLWPKSFCTILLLLLCVEEIQITAIASIGVEDVVGKLPPTRPAAVKACQALEGSLEAIIGLFHAIYRTDRSLVDGGGFNVLKKLLAGQDIPYEGDSDLGVENASGVMIEGFETMFESFREYHSPRRCLYRLTFLAMEMKELAQPPKFEAHSEIFVIKNKGRLVSKFLLSFLDKATLADIEQSCRGVLAADGD